MTQKVFLLISIYLNLLQSGGGSLYTLIGFTMIGFTTIDPATH